RHDPGTSAKSPKPRSISTRTVRAAPPRPPIRGSGLYICKTAIRHPLPIDPNRGIIQTTRPSHPLLHIGTKAEMHLPTVSARYLINNRLPNILFFRAAREINERRTKP